MTGHTMVISAPHVIQLVLNRGRLGYYRVQYDKAGYKWMRADFISKSPHLPGIDRAAFVYDLSAFARSGRTRTVEVLELVRYVVNDTDSEVWEAALTFLRDLESLLWEQSQDEQNALKRFSASIVGDTYMTLGLYAGKNETATKGKMRQLILPVAGRAGIPSLVDDSLKILGSIYDRENGLPGAELPDLPANFMAVTLETVSLGGVWVSEKVLTWV